MCKKLLLSAFVFLFFPSVVLAQTERLPGVVDKPQPGVDVDLRKPAEPLKDSPDFKKPSDAGTVIGTFRSVEFKGATVLSDSYLKSIAQPYLDKPMTKGDLVDLKYAITRAFYDEGYILVKVVTPQQDARSGILRIEIYEAEVGKVIIHDQDGVLNDHISNSMGRRFADGEVFEQSAAESTVSDLNELKNVAASLNLQPGERFKTTDLNVYLNEANEDVQRFSVDNYGSQLTGTNVATLHLEHSNALHLGETFEADLRKSNDDLWSVGAGVKTPIGFQNVKLEIYGLRSENEINDRLASLDASGETSMFDVALSKNFINTRKTKVTSRAGIEYRNHKSFLVGALDTKDKIRQAFLDTSILRREEGGVFFASARLSRGIDILDASNKGDVNASRATGDPEAVIFEPLVLLNFRPDIIPGVPSIDGEFRIFASGQVSDSTLLSSDLMVVGGYGSVRGFEVAQETGEAGYQFSVEYDHYLDLINNWRIKAGPFFDGATLYNRVNGNVEDKNLYSAGVGLEARTDLIQAGETRFRFDIAKPIGDYRSQEVENYVGYFSVTQAF